MRMERRGRTSFPQIIFGAKTPQFIRKNQGYFTRKAEAYKMSFEKFKELSLLGLGTVLKVLLSFWRKKRKRHYCLVSAKY